MKKYDSYKDSGIEWIGEIPEHWEVSRIKYYLDYQKGKNPKEINFDKGSTSEIYLAMDFLRGEPRQILYVDDTDGYVKVDENEILLLWDGSNAGEFILSKRGILSSTMAVIYLNNIKKRYSWYYLKNFEPRLKENTIGMGIPHVNGEELKNGYITIPPISEQTAIASFLDRKTSEIDDIIADKKRLLELYEEEKTAIINQAVTKGLDPNAPMKDSGIEWLGEIPEHWEVKRLKYVGKIKYGLGQPPKHKLDGLPIIRATNVFRGRIDEKDLIFVDPDDIPYERDPILRTNDIIVVRSGAYTADSAIIPSKFDGAVTGYDMVFSCNKDHNPKFISFGLLSDYILKRQLIMHSLRAAQPHLNREELGETLIAVPPYNIQQSIVHHIESECSEIDFKKARTEELIELLTEYRTALISEAVTGKIKVTED